MCTSYFIYITAIISRLPSLALKGFQDSNLLVHVHEYFNFHLVVFKLNSKYHFAYEMNRVIDEVKPVCRYFENGLMPFSIWKFSYTLFHCNFMYNRNCVTCANEKNIIHTYIERKWNRNWHRNYLVVVNNKFKLPYSIVVGIMFEKMCTWEKGKKILQWVAGAFSFACMHIHVGLQRKQMTKVEKEKKKTTT